jgi:DNA-binding NarL/FixJ family response regulator
MRSEILASPGPLTIWPTTVFAQSDASRGRNVDERRRVLLVEDDFLVAGEIEYLLAGAGFAVIGPAATAEAAVRLAAETNPDLVVMDVRLAGTRDGIDAAIEIYREFGIRSLFATAHADGATVARGRVANPFGWVAKPYNPAVLIREIKALLRE